MEYIYAAMLLHRAGKQVTEATMDATLKSAGVQVDSARVKATVAALKDANIDEIIKNSKLSAQAAAPAEAKSGATEAKKDEKAESKVSEEEAAAGLSALFG